MTYKVGSNQYRKIPKSHALEIILGTAALIYFVSLPWSKPVNAIDENTKTLQQYQFGVNPAVTINTEVKIAGTSGELELEPTKENIVAYIMKVFGKYGTGVAVKAIDCFYSESGLRTDAYNFNKNGTEDRGVAQINSIHGLKPEEAHNFMKNIDMAEKVFLRAGKSFRPWYGKLCN